MRSERFKEGLVGTEDERYINDKKCWLLEVDKFCEATWPVMEPKWILKQLESSSYS